jgi:hypothetical protein
MRVARLAAIITANAGLEQDDRMIERIQLIRKIGMFDSVVTDRQKFAVRYRITIARYKIVREQPCCSNLVYLLEHRTAAQD